VTANFLDSDQKSTITDDFLKTLSGLYAVTFALLSLVFANYGLRLTILLSHLRDEEQTMQQRILDESLITLLYKRVLLITIILSVIFFCTCIYNCIYTWGLMEQGNSDP